MPTNFNTPNSIILRFPRYAGGKFIGNCLALSKHAVPQHAEIAQNLLSSPNDCQYRLREIMKTLPSTQDQMKNWVQQFEYGDKQLFGPVGITWRKQGSPHKLAVNTTTTQLSNSDLCFFHVSHNSEDSLENLLKVWPNSRIIQLINHATFSTISKYLKCAEPNITPEQTGNYSPEKYAVLAGSDWPTWQEFLSVKFDTRQLPLLADHIVAEINSFYPPITMIPFDIDNCIFEKTAFLESMCNLYNSLGFTDFDSKLVGEFWQAYINLHEINE